MSETRKYKQISNDTFEEVVIAKKAPSVLVFGAEWSGNSEIMDDMVRRISSEFNSNINFFKVDIEKQTEISTFFGVYSVPTMVILKEGEVVEFIKGFIPAKKIRAKIASLFESTQD